MQGKVADVVMAVRNGVQIARKYQPVVSNPSTQLQVESRAKLKMMSQLSAVLAPVIAMPRMGSVSSRNRFVKANYELASYLNNEANVQVEKLKLTNSVVSLPDIEIDRSGLNSTVSLSAPAQGLSRVVYVVLGREADNSLRLIAERVVENPGTGSIYGESIPLGTTGEVFVLGYGVRDNTDAARARFGNVQVLTASDVAKLIVTRTLTDTDITLTETKGLYSSSSPNAQNAATPTENNDENRTMKKK